MKCDEEIARDFPGRYRTPTISGVNAAFCQKGMRVRITHGYWPGWMKKLRIPYRLREFLQRIALKFGKNFGPQAEVVTISEILDGKITYGETA